MNFPKQIRQHKNESDSFAIILYKLRELGIFRNITAQDYGIDFEIELVESGRVSGHCVKVQVKSSENLHIGADGRPTIGGIKQTTLRYWAELSFSIPVIALCVDLKNETVYMTEPLFWQAVTSLDATERSKTIYFNKETDIDKIIENIRDIANGYSLREELLAHKWLVRNLEKLFGMYDDSWWYDRGSQNVDIVLFKTFLENAKVFLNPLIMMDKNNAKAYKTLLSYDYYYVKSDYDEPYNYVIYEGLKQFFLAFLKMMDIYRSRIMVSGYFWVYNDDDYFRMVAETEIPTFDEENKLKEFKHGEFFSKRKEHGWFTKCLTVIEQEAKCKENELMNYLIGKNGHYTI